MSYKGWSNYETWFINEHYFGKTTLAEIVDFFNVSKTTTVGELADLFKQSVQQDIDDYLLVPDSHLNDMLTYFIEEVIFEELALRYMSKITNSKIKLSNESTSIGTSCVLSVCDLNPENEFTLSRTANH